MKRWEGWGVAVAGSVFLALVSTFGDWFWARFIPSHEVVYGVAHGAIMCVCIGLVLGASRFGKRALVRGTVGTLIVGVVVSGAFYPLYGLIGIASMFVCWAALWIAFALLHRKLGFPGSIGSAIGRGLAGALLSGAGFYPIYVLWTQPPKSGSIYLMFLGAWLVAFLPGFLALFLRRRAPLFEGMSR